MTSAYNGRITGINRTEGKNFKVVWPGSIYAVDSWVVLKDAENKDAAQDFIAFASLPETSGEAAGIRRLRPAEQGSCSQGSGGIRQGPADRSRRT